MGSLTGLKLCVRARMVSYSCAIHAITACKCLSKRVATLCEQLAAAQKEKGSSVTQAVYVWTVKALKLSNPGGVCLDGEGLTYVSALRESVCR
jgi:hypothetical protein